MSFRLAPYLIAAAVTASASIAHAGPPFWMNDLRVDNRVGVEMSLGNPPGPVGDSLTINSDVFGKFAVGNNLLLGFRVPLAISFFDDAIDGDDSGAALGNIGLNVTGVTLLSRGRTAMRAGLGGTLYLNTVSDGIDSGAVASSAALLAIPDQGRWANATTFRGRGDFIVQSDAFFLQTELNLDLLFRDGDDDVDLAIGFGPGVDVSSNLALQLEISVANITDNSLIVLDLGMRYQTRGFVFGGRVYLPTEELGGEDVVGLGLDFSGRF
ncbi:MAG: hypothetical protein KJO07_00705 [Deltaproteobacteria bacterium]|nr:hypothetical protein [Deltaproteobacteria bacterium]